MLAVSPSAAPGAGAAGLANFAIADEVVFAKSNLATSQPGDASLFEQDFHADANDGGAGGPFALYSATTGQGGDPLAFRLYAGQAVLPIPTVSLSSSLNPSMVGQSVTFTVTVTGSAGTPTGTVQFQNGGVNLGSAVALDSSGTATLITSSLPLGTDNITAVYSGDGNYQGATSNTVAQVVNPANNPAPTITSLSPSSTQAGSAAFTLTITGTNFLPSSTVTFGSASLTPTVNTAGTQITVTVPAASVATAGPVTVTVTNPAPGGGSANTTFTITKPAPVDVTSQLKVSISGLVFARADKTFNGTITLTNTGGLTIAGPLQVVLTGLTPGVPLVNATGSVPNGPLSGAPYITSAGSLAPGASVTVPVKFSDPTQAAINYGVDVLSGSF